MGRPRMPGTALVSLLAALACFVTMLAWAGFSERPSGYLVPILGGCLIIALSGMLLRSARLPALAVLAVQVLILALWLQHEWAGAQALGGWIPTSDSIQGVRTAIADSLSAAQSYASPVPESVPQFNPIMEVLGVATALMVDFLAGGLRRAPLAGLPLLAVYMAPVSILDGGVSWLKFAFAATAFLALVAAEEGGRLSHWGHQVGGRIFDSQATTVSSHAVWSSARKIGATATGLAVIAPFVVPTLGTSIFSGHGHGPGGSGGSVELHNPMVDMKRDLTRGANIQLLSVHTRVPDPSYFQITVLNQFNGEQWAASSRDIPTDQRAEGLVTRPPGLDATVATKHATYTVTSARDFHSSWLPAPYPVYSITAPGDWRYDQSTLDFISAASGLTTSGLTYHLDALDVAPTGSELADAGPAPATVFGPDTRLPKGMPPLVSRLAHRVTAKATTKFQAAVMLQDWFRVGGGFSYSLATAPGDGVNDLVRFLGTGPGSRSGYCQQFASSMAVMARTLGIPARVVVGFLHSHQTSNDTYAFNSHDMHAWPELYFGGYGWVRFEPTPGTRTGPAPTYTRHIDRGPGTTQATSSAAALPTLNRFTAASAAAGPKTKVSQGSSSLHGSVPIRVLIATLLILVLLLVPRSTRRLRRRRRWAVSSPRELPEAAWAEVRDSALDLGIAWDDAVTVRHRARDLLRSFGALDEAPDALGRARVRGAAANPKATRALDRVVRLLERARYARIPPTTEVEADTVRGDVALVVEALEAGASGRARLRSRWLPASLWRGWSGRSSGPKRGATRLSEPGIDHAV